MALETQDLVMQYGSYRALRDVSLVVPDGQYAIIIGENGAGKSTLLRCLAGWLRPSGGMVTVRGLSIEEHERTIRQWVKYVPDTPQFYPELTAWEHVEVVARANRQSGDWRARGLSLLEAFSLDAHRNALPASFSRGMQYKLAVALSLLANPEILLLDEPFGPLDPYSQTYLARRLADLVRNGATVVASTHLLPEGNPPERVVVLDQGQVAEDGPLTSWWDGETPLSTVPSRLLEEVLTARRTAADE